eukprot:COSAG05_NODE_21272_length_273_cov_0.591954_1_plen_41_part_10
MFLVFGGEQPAVGQARSKPAEEKATGRPRDWRPRPTLWGRH